MRSHIILLKSHNIKDHWAEHSWCRPSVNDPTLLVEKHINECFCVFLPPPPVYILINIRTSLHIKCHMQEHILCAAESLSEIEPCPNQCHAFLIPHFPTCTDFSLLVHNWWKNTVISMLQYLWGPVIPVVPNNCIVVNARESNNHQTGITQKVWLITALWSTNHPLYNITCQYFICNGTNELF